jgi:hypothetical protein
MTNPRLLLTVLVFATAMPAFAQLRDTELKVERRTLDREDKIAKPRSNAEELTRGLRITVRNTSIKPQAEGEVEWSILVARPGMERAPLSTGTEKLKALQTSEAATFDVGAVPVQSRGAERQDMDYRVVVRRGDAQVAEVESKPNFAQLAQAARPMAQAGRKGKGARKEKIELRTDEPHPRLLASPACRTDAASLSMGKNHWPDPSRRSLAGVWRMWGDVSKRALRR